MIATLEEAEARMFGKGKDKSDKKLDERSKPKSVREPKEEGAVHIEAWSGAGAPASL